MESYYNCKCTSVINVINLEFLVSASSEEDAVNKAKAMCRNALKDEFVCKCEEVNKRD